MKYFSLLLFITVVAAGCQKNNDLIQQQLQDLARPASKGGGGGGGNTTTFLQNVLSGTASRLAGGSSDSIFVSFTQPSPAGWVLKLTSSDATTVKVPATYTVPQGVYNVSPPVISSPVASSKLVTVTVALGTESKSTTLKVFPTSFNFPAPQLQFPGNGSGFKSRIQVKFTWSDNANAFYHDIQISDDPAFSNTPMLEVYTNDPIWAASYFNGFGKRYWRVRYVDAGLHFGPWSAVRNFEIKP